MIKYTIAAGLFLISGLLVAQDSDYLASIQQYREEKRLVMKDKEKSPLEKKDRRKFKDLNYYEIDKAFRIKGTFSRKKGEKPFKMKTSGEKTPEYVKYATIRFQIGDNHYAVDVFQHVARSKAEDYDGSLFIPFTDLTNGNTTYGGGRYIDFKIPKSEDVFLDFNKAYNPYCSYGDGWNCPIPPPQNFVKAEIKAGEKLFNTDH